MYRTLIAVGLLTLSSVAQAGAVASSFKKETRRGANFWNAQAAIDGKLDTCWMVPGESANRGEWIELDVPKSTVDKLGMVVGWAKDEDTFKDYARVKKVRVQAFRYDDDNNLVPAGSTEAEFKDEMGMQIVDIDDLQVGDDMFGGKVRITIEDVYPGRDFPSLAVSEVLLVLGEFDAAPQIREVSSEDKPREALIDDNPKSFWAGSSDGARIVFEAPGFSLSKVGLLPGPADYDRPKKVKVIANNRETIADIPEGGEEHWIEIPAIVGYTGSAWGKIELQILETWPGRRYPGTVALSELDLKATAYEGI